MIAVLLMGMTGESLPNFVQFSGEANIKVSGL